MEIKKEERKLWKILTLRNFLPNFIKERKTEGRRILPKGHDKEF
jgi:hypothetical protein